MLSPTVSVGIQYPTIKLLDYQSSWQELESSLNPFAMMVMAHLKTKSTTNNLSERERWKWYFIRSLYEKGYEKKEIIKLFKLIDLMMSLTDVLQASLEQKITNYEEERKMPLLSNLELRAIEKGRQQGINNMVQSILISRFGEID